MKDSDRDIRPAPIDKDLQRISDEIQAKWSEIWPSDVDPPSWLLEALAEMERSLPASPPKRSEYDPTRLDLPAEDIPPPTTRRVAGQPVWMWVLILCFTPATIMIIMLAEAILSGEILSCP